MGEGEGKGGVGEGGAGEGEYKNTTVSGLKCVLGWALCHFPVSHYFAKLFILVGLSNRCQRGWFGWSGICQAVPFKV